MTVFTDAVIVYSESHKKVVGATTVDSKMHLSVQLRLPVVLSILHSAIYTVFQ